MKKLFFVFSMLATLGITQFAVAEGNNSSEVLDGTCCLKATITEDNGSSITINACGETCDEALKDVKDTIAILDERG